MLKYIQPKTISLSSPWEMAEAEFNSYEEFIEVIEICGRIGIIISDFDIMCAIIPSRINKAEGSIEILSKKELNMANGYVVSIAAGNLKKAMDAINPVEFLAYERNNKTIIVKWSRVYSLIKYG